MNIIKGKLKKINKKWHKYLEGKILLLGCCMGKWLLIGIIGEEDIINFSKFVWETSVEIREEYFNSLEGFIEEIRLGNDGFMFELGEIEVTERMY